MKTLIAVDLGLSIPATLKVAVIGLLPSVSGAEGETLITPFAARAAVTVVEPISVVPL